MSDIFEFNEKPYSLGINLQFRPEDSNDKIWHEDKKYGIEFFSDRILSCQLRFKKTVLQGHAKHILTK